MARGYAYSLLTLKSKNIATAEKHQHTNAHLTWRLNLEVIGLCVFFSCYTQVECIHVNYSSAFIHAAFLQSWLPIFFSRSFTRSLLGIREMCFYLFMCSSEFAFECVYLCRYVWALAQCSVDLHNTESRVRL